jgi:hypothetical protein
MYNVVFTVTLGLNMNMRIDEIALNSRFATRAETAELATNLAQQMPQIRFKVEKKPTSPVFYIRVFGTDLQQMITYFNSHGLDSLPLEPQQAAISGKYRRSILSYYAEDVIYTLVVASSGKGDSETGVSVSIKEFTPTSLGLAGITYTKDSLLQSTQDVVIAKTQDRPELQAVLLGLLDVAAAGGKGTLPPEVNQNLSSRARDQLSVDFGEILAPIMMAKGNERIEFPAEGNFPLIDVIVGDHKYSVKSLTGSGTSFRSVSDLMDNFEGTVKNDKTQEKLFALFKSFHPKAGGKNVDKLIRAAQFIKTPEYTAAVKVFGPFEDWKSLRAQMQNWAKSFTPDAKGYKNFLTTSTEIFDAGNWGKPVGMPADGKFYLGTSKQKDTGEEKEEKEAGFASFRADPAKAATNIITYSLGVGTLNKVTRGPDAEEYTQMMTNIVNQSPAYLGLLDITNGGGLVVSAKPFSDLQFRFQYHAPSHKPGNNLPGFMIMY